MERQVGLPKTGYAPGDNERSISRKTTATPPRNPAETLRLLHSEVQALLARQLQGLRELDGKNGQLMTLSATMLALVIAGVSILANAAAPTGLVGPAVGVVEIGIVLLCGGIFAFLLAIAFSVVAYLNKGIFVGLAPDGIKGVTLRGATPRAYLEVAIDTYLQGVERLEIKNAKTARRLEWTIRFFVAGMAWTVAGSIVLIGKVLPI